MTNIRKRFAKNLRMIRKTHGVTQERLAEKLDISVRYIQELEGRNVPNVKLDTLAKLAKALRAKPSDFLL